MSRRVLQVTVHDASPDREEVLREMDAALREAGAFPYALLVIPSRHDAWPLEEHPGFCAWLRELDAGGVRMMLHGLHHRGGAECRGPVSALRRALFTRGEGEFLCLSAAEASRRLEAGGRVLDRVLGRKVTAFTAPAWLYSRGTLRALAERGFAYAESRWRQWDPSTGRTLLRAPVLNYAGGGALKRAAAAAWVRVGRLLLARAGTLRVALHPDDFLDPSRRAAATGLLRRLLRDRVCRAPGGTP